LIRLTKVSKAYLEGDRRRHVLRGVDVHIREGEWVALLGPSGSGKTTLLNLVGGLDTPDEGVVSVAGQAISDLSERARALYRRAGVGFIFQFFNLLPTLTVLENLLLPTELGGMDRTVAKRRAIHLLERVGLGDRRDSFPDVLSGGERQRVAVARSLVHEPPLVLADEPTGNLDAETGAGVLALMEELLRESGRTLLMVTHSDEWASRADRVLTLRGGTLHELPAAGR